jgi:hypothetical protein
VSHGKEQDTGTFRGVFVAYPDAPPQRLRHRLGRFTSVTDGMLKDLKKGHTIEISFTSLQDRDQASRSLHPLGKLSPA